MMHLRAFQLVLGRKFCVESEFGVKNQGFSRSGAKNYEKLPRKVLKFSRGLGVLFNFPGKIPGTSEPGWTTLYA